MRVTIPTRTACARGYSHGHNTLILVYISVRVAIYHTHVYSIQTASWPAHIGLICSWFYPIVLICSKWSCVILSGYLLWWFVPYGPNRPWSSIGIDYVWLCLVPYGPHVSQMVFSRSLWNIQSSLHENAVFSVCTCVGNAAYIIFIMWNFIFGLDPWYHFQFNIKCGLAVMGRSHKKNQVII